MGFPYYRQPKTKDEITQYNAVVNEYGIPIKIRGRRRPRSLYFVWDDYFTHTEKNWKRYRKNQWKIK